MWVDTNALDGKVESPVVLKKIGTLSVSNCKSFHLKKNSKHLKFDEIYTI